ncbi:MAG: GNAT family N-acetyltransferase [Robiginitomaculum sp.]|nr:GNAT family N-acetyltransferase [Robiginitomaculum sp.]
MAEPLLVEKFSESKAQAVINLMCSTQSIDHHTEYTLWQAATFDPDFFWVANHGGKLAGYVFGRMVDSEAFLWQVAVSKEKRKKGVGRALIDAFFREAKSKKATAILTTITADNTASEGLIGSVAKQYEKNMVLSGATGTFGGTMSEENFYRISLE